MTTFTTRRPARRPAPIAGALALAASLLAGCGHAAMSVAEARPHDGCNVIAQRASRRTMSVAFWASTGIPRSRPHLSRQSIARWVTPSSIRMSG